MPETPSSKNIEITEAVTPVDLFAGGSRESKNAHQEEDRTDSVRAIAQSIKINSKIVEDRNSIDVFSSPESAGFPETADSSLQKEQHIL